MLRGNGSASNKIGTGRKLSLASPERKGLVVTRHEDQKGKHDDGKEGAKPSPAGGGTHGN